MSAPLLNLRQRVSLRAELIPSSAFCATDSTVVWLLLQAVVVRITYRDLRSDLISY